MTDKKADTPEAAAAAPTPKTVKALVLSDFGDAGTGVGHEVGVERNFKAGATIDLSEGEFANYATAGLVRAPKGA